MGFKGDAWRIQTGIFVAVSRFDDLLFYQIFVVSKLRAGALHV